MSIIRSLVLISHDPESKLLGSEAIFAAFIITTSRMKFQSHTRRILAKAPPHPSSSFTLKR